ncbi:MAG TPA: aminoglycoside phosphotransferase family protein [Candidatus Limnocylindrales bacterium]|jgi:hypothetical protein
MSSQRSSTPPRRASLVLCGPGGAVLGRLPDVAVRTPWWPDIEAVVDAARDAYGLEVVVLRMLDSELPRPHGGRVTYLAEVPDRLPPAAVEALEPWDGVLDEQPLRLPYAHPGGPAADLAWAEGVLRSRGIERSGPAVQVRSWNLSSIWRLPLAGAGPAWLKVVPPFFGHEGDILRRLQAGPVPRLLGHDGHRILLADIEGEDQYDAPLPVLLRMVSMLVELQADWIGREEELLAMRLPDWRGPTLGAAIADVVERRRSELPPSDAAALDPFVAGLPARFEAVAAAGIPDTLVHGDFHPGNVRGTAFRLTLLDWGDTGVGHPLLDLPAFLAAIDADAAEPVREHWLAAWRAAVPGSSPEQAARLLAPVAAARQAVIYQRFVDGIEPVERRHHDADVGEWLARAAALSAG